MSDDELRYRHGSNPDRPEPRGPKLLAGLVVLLLLVAAGAAIWTFRPSAKPAPAVAPAAPAAPPPPVAAPAPAPAPPPPLDGSDAAVRDRLAALSGAPEWAAWLAADDLVRRAVSALARTGEGKSPLAAFDHLRLEGAFAVASRGGRTTIDPATYARYDRPTAVLAALDVDAAAAAWRWLRPLAEAAWREIAPPHESLEAGVARALDHLLATPRSREPVEVRLEDGLYRFVDPVLESLTPAQKHLLRAGPENGERLRALLTSLRSRLVAPA